MSTACRRESVTPDDAALSVIAPGVGKLIVDCEVHGEIGSVPAGGKPVEDPMTYDDPVLVQ
ncbi:MAG TPA: hypothetical protein VGJ13_05360 [Pseudonocardiaceae bacterium]|jgi:hypothetical protein